MGSLSFPKGSYLALPLNLVTRLSPRLNRQAAISSSASYLLAQSSTLHTGMHTGSAYMVILVPMISQMARLPLYQLSEHLDVPLELRDPPSIETPITFPKSRVSAFVNQPPNDFRTAIFARGIAQQRAPVSESTDRISILMIKHIDVHLATFNKMLQHVDTIFVPGQYLLRYEAFC